MPGRAGSFFHFSDIIFATDALRPAEKTHIQYRENWYALCLAWTEESLVNKNKKNATVFLPFFLVTLFLPSQQKTNRKQGRAGLASYVQWTLERVRAKASDEAALGFHTCKGPSAASNLNVNEGERPIEFRTETEESA